MRGTGFREGIRWGRAVLPVALMGLGGCGKEGVSPIPGEGGGEGLTPEDVAGVTAGADPTGVGDDDTAAPVLYGTEPPTPLPVPDFQATNQAGVARGPEDLLNHPTALWFFTTDDEC